MPGTHEYKGFVIKVVMDTDPIHPREDGDPLGTMVCWHRRYNLGDEQPKIKASQYWWHQMYDMHHNIPDELSTEHVANWVHKHHCVLPVYLFDHGGITLSTGRFNCPWDSGQVGFIYVSLEKARKWLGVNLKWNDLYEPTGTTFHQQCEEMLREEVKAYNQYLQGEVYGYTIEDEDGNQMDSCWGFYEEDYCLTEAKAEVDRLSERLAGQTYSI